MPRPEKKKPDAPEKPAGQKLKSGVEVWYPPSLYKNAGGPSTSAGSPKPVAKLNPKVSTLAVSSPPESSRKKSRSPLNQEGNKKPARIGKRATLLSASPAISSQATVDPGNVKLKSGVAVWYPDALYPKSPGSTKPAQSIFTDEPPALLCSDDIPQEMRKKGWTTRSSQDTGKKYYFNTKTSQSLYERPHFFGEAETLDDEGEADDTPPKKRVWPKWKKVDESKQVSDDEETQAPVKKVWPKWRKTHLDKEAEEAQKSRKPIFKKVVPTKSYPHWKGVVHETVDDDDVEMMDTDEDLPSFSSQISEESMEVDTLEAVKSLRLNQDYAPGYIPRISVPEAPVLNAAEQEPVFCFVWDTNVFLSEKGGNFLVALASNRLPQLPAVQVRIPHVVFVELDQLKMRKGSPVSLLAVQAIRFLNDRILIYKDPRFIGQTAAEYSQGIVDFPPLMNDDRVLVYYLQIKAQKHRRYRPVCVTNDVNLRTRAAVNGISTISGAQFFEEVGRRMRGEHSMFDETVPSVEAFTFSTTSTETFVSIPANVCCHLQRCIQIIMLKILSGVVENRMKQLYDDVWLQVVKIRPPWSSVSVVVDVMLKHWIAAFGDIFNHNDKSLLASLIAIDTTGSVERNTDESIVVGLKVITAVEKLDARTRSNYDHVVSGGRLLIQRWRDMFERARKGLQSPDPLLTDCNDFLRSNA